MGEIAPFVPAIPAMIVGHALDGSTPPLGLGEPFALLGGDRLGPDGIPFQVMHDHQPMFLRWVTQSCEASLTAERFWFRGRAAIFTGWKGAGRTHAARWLARCAGVPHVILNISDPIIASAVASSGAVSEALVALPITVAMAAKRCANPMVSVIGVDQASDDVKAGLAAMMDKDAGVYWSEDQLGTCVDLSQVTWIIQAESAASLPPAIRNEATNVAFSAAPRQIESVFTLSIMLEVMADLGVEPTDPSYAWSRIKDQLPSYYQLSGKALYADMIDAISSLKHVPLLEARGDPDDVPY